MPQHLNTTCWCLCSIFRNRFFPGSFRTHRRQGFPRRNRHFTGGVGCERPQRRMAQSVVLVQTGGANLAGYRGYLCGPDIYDRMQPLIYSPLGILRSSLGPFSQRSGDGCGKFFDSTAVFIPCLTRPDGFWGYVALALVLYGVSVVRDDHVAPAVPRYACYAALLLLTFTMPCGGEDGPRGTGPFRNAPGAQIATKDE